MSDTPGKLAPDPSAPRRGAGKAKLQPGFPRPRWGRSPRAGSSGGSVAGGPHPRLSSRIPPGCPPPSPPSAPFTPPKTALHMTNMHPAPGWTLPRGVGKGLRVVRRPFLEPRQVLQGRHRPPRALCRVRQSTNSSLPRPSSDRRSINSSLPRPRSDRRSISSSLPRPRSNRRSINSSRPSPCSDRRSTNSSRPGASSDGRALRSWPPARTGRTVGAARTCSLPRSRGAGGRRPDEGGGEPTPTHATPHPNPLPSAEEGRGSRRR